MNDFEPEVYEEARHLRALLKRAVALLRDLEQTPDRHGVHGDACASCQQEPWGRSPGHDADCALAAFLREVGDV